MKDTIAEKLKDRAEHQGNRGPCSFRICRVCGNADLISWGVDRQQPVTISWEFGGVFCEHCQEIQRRHPELFHWIGRVLDFDPIYREHLKEKAAQEVEELGLCPNQEAVKRQASETAMRHYEENAGKP